MRQYEQMSRNELLTSRQLARELETTVTTVNRWVNSGRITPALQVPGYRGARLFEPASIEALRKGTK